MIIDAHVHLPLATRKGEFKLKKHTLISTMNRNDIDYAILIPDNIKNSNIGDLYKCLEIANKEKRLFLVGVIDSSNLNKQKLNLDRLFKQGKIKGIKIFPGHDPISPIDKRFNSFYKLCIKYNLPLLIHTGRGSLKEKNQEFTNPEHILKLAKKFPHLKIVACHFYPPNPKVFYKLTKKHKNIFYDISSLAFKEYINKIGKGNLIQFLREVIKENPEKVLFGSDYGCCGMKNHVELINSLRIPERLKKRVFYKNSQKVFNLEK
ncbi:MAG: amidohydrolase family protein [Nanoarchaeota archaeon]